jgi:hypothetical protein
MVTGEELWACRRAREVVADMRWHGMTVPALYTRMAQEFEDLVRSGDYAAWVAANKQPALFGRRPHAVGLPNPVCPGRSQASHSAPPARRTSGGRPPRRGLLLPGPIVGR